MYSKHRKVIFGVLVAMLALPVAVYTSIFLEGGPRDIKAEDKPYVWSYDESQDLQEPELPTGCEATSLSILLRLEGHPVTKEQAALAMPRTDDLSEFPYAFYGDPYSEHGFTIGAPGIVDTAYILGYEDVITCNGLELSELQAPYIVWTTMGLEPPRFYGLKVYTDDYPYDLIWNTHCMVVMSMDDERVKVVDPLAGVIFYDRETFESVYDECGRHAVRFSKEG